MLSANNQVICSFSRFDIKIYIRYDEVMLNVLKYFWRWNAVNTVLERNAITVRDGRTITFRKPDENDGREMFRIVEESKVLDVNSSYSYLMWSKYFNETSIVAESEDKVIGFVSGFIQPTSLDTLFCMASCRRSWF